MKYRVRLGFRKEGKGVPAVGTRRRRDARRKRIKGCLFQEGMSSYVQDSVSPVSKYLKRGLEACRKVNRRRGERRARLCVRATGVVTIVLPSLHEI